eukprot:Hpha_TRINITY_DN2938_c0_g1::TRINITY_DN2938_c0_g1_i1::g.19587::m.19587
MTCGQDHSHGGSHGHSHHQDPCQPSGAQASPSFGPDIQQRVAELKRLGAVQHFAGLDPESAAVLGKLLLGEVEGGGGDLLVGSEVEAHSLKSAGGAGFNGKQGRVLGFKDDRVEVDFGGEVGVKALRNQNLRRIKTKGGEQPIPREIPAAVGDSLETSGGDIKVGPWKMSKTERAIVLDVRGDGHVKLRVESHGDSPEYIPPEFLQRREGDPLLPCYHEAGDNVYVTREGATEEGVVESVDPLKISVDGEWAETFEESNVWMRLEAGDTVQYRTEGGWAAASVVAAREEGKVYDIVPHAARKGVLRDWPEGALRRRDLPQTSKWFGEVQEWLRGKIKHELDGKSPGEKMVFPGEGSGFEDHTEKDTVVVDSFLYDDDLIDEMVDQGKLTRAYCTDCGSKRCKPVNFITHSLALSQFRFLFDHTSPQSSVFAPGELEGKVLLDVGSRTGACLMCALRFRGAELKEVIGVEINSYFCQIQRELADSFAPRARIVEGDIFADSGMAELRRADVVMLHNVFQWFHEPAKQRDMWGQLREALRGRAGVTLISVPSVQALVEPLGLDPEEWLEAIELEYPDEDDQDADDGNRMIFKYKTKGC